MIKYRNTLKCIILTMITCGLYGFLYWGDYTEDVNRLCADDNKETRSFANAVLFGIITCGLYPIVWQYGMGGRLFEKGQKLKIQMPSPVVFTLLGMLVSSDMINKLAEANNMLEK